MKFTGTHFGLVFLTSAELSPDDFLDETQFVMKLSALFATWDNAVANTEIPEEEDFKKLCESTEMCNLVVKNFEGNNCFY